MAEPMPFRTSRTLSLGFSGAIKSAERPCPGSADGLGESGAAVELTGAGGGSSVGKVTMASMATARVMKRKTDNA